LHFLDCIRAFGGKTNKRNPGHPKCLGKKFITLDTIRSVMACIVQFDRPCNPKITRPTEKEIDVLAIYFVLSASPLTWGLPTFYLEDIRQPYLGQDPILFPDHPLKHSEKRPLGR